MRVGFIAEPYEESHASGMGYVVLELLRKLALKPEHTLVVYSSRPVNRTLVPGDYENVLIPASFVGKLWWGLRLREDIDALMFQVPLLPLIVPKRIKVIAMCQELGSQKTRPDGMRARALAFLRDRVLMPLCLRRATRITTASEATKADVVTFYGYAPESVQVIHDGYQDLSAIAADASVVTDQMRPYFLFAGKVKSRKNVHGIVAGFIGLKQRTRSDAKLVIAGDFGGPYYDAMLQALKDSGLEHDVFFIGYANAAAMVALYQGAIAFVFPSFNEGFGMPIAEAMSLGTPVITSNISSMPEVAGDAALLVDPHNPEDIAGAMERLVSEPELRAELIERGRAQAAHFSWCQAGEAYAKLISDL